MTPGPNATRHRSCYRCSLNALLIPLLICLALILGYAFRATEPQIAPAYTVTVQWADGPHTLRCTDARGCIEITTRPIK